MKNFAFGLFCILMLSTASYAESCPINSGDYALEKCSNTSHWMTNYDHLMVSNDCFEKPPYINVVWNNSSNEYKERIRWYFNTSGKRFKRSRNLGYYPCGDDSIVGECFFKVEYTATGIATSDGIRGKTSRILKKYDPFTTVLGDFFGSWKIVTDGHTYSEKYSIHVSEGAITFNITDESGTNVCTYLKK
ncbi:MAG: hypothetical protein A2428_08315 [Bdellovibrionales bacterium RIFOXYC1_FULL_54_43]|nr:MAG: hypothetical protein A2428_08315 [Bdellovibrionales bacterium RIFOXYC1_FULL_54_43]OFZ78629.1 MAG: hypothetical protein A2603_12795 [Bdellovibrionales bacterium RIFOXYD1_FULL_55_31]